MTKQVRSRRPKTKNTPLRVGIKKNSFLQARVEDGMGAVNDEHRDCFDSSVRALFLDSVDIDKAFQIGHEQENRWDYLLGHSSGKKIVGVEPHSAENSEISTVIRKRAAALRQLQGHLNNGVAVSDWLWVASNRVQFVPLEKATLRLSQNGITFVGRRVLAKHLP